MRLWSLVRGPPFKCHLGDNCSGGLFGKEIANDGDNRFSCFVCDYNLCRTCYEGNLEYDRLETEDVKLEVAGTKAFCQICMRFRQLNSYLLILHLVRLKKSWQSIGIRFWTSPLMCLAKRPLELLVQLSKNLSGIFSGIQKLVNAVHVEFIARSRLASSVDADLKANAADATVAAAAAGARQLRQQHQATDGEGDADLARTELGRTSHFQKSRSR
jgi:hypothetical protein